MNWVVPLHIERKLEQKPYNSAYRRKFLILLIPRRRAECVLKSTLNSPTRALNIHKHWPMCICKL